jgi:hypothetical protein
MTWTQVELLAYFCKDLKLGSPPLVAALQLFVRIQQFTQQVFAALHKNLTSNDRLEVTDESTSTNYATFTAVTKHQLQRHYGGVRQESFNRSGIEVKLWLNHRQGQWELRFKLFRHPYHHTYLTVWIQNEHSVRRKGLYSKAQHPATLLEVYSEIETFCKDIA